MKHFWNLSELGDDDDTNEEKAGLQSSEGNKTAKWFVKRLLEATQGKETGIDIWTCKYVDLRFMVPTSNMCEVLVSVARSVLNERRVSTLPNNFECQLFVRVNQEFWRIQDVHELIE